jgi:glycosyltransferase involved in cell wall biosynthesis
VFSHARLFVLPSYHEGLPISLLEALSYGLMPLVSDIPANLEVSIDSAYYFQCKNIENLKDKLIQLWQSEFSLEDSEQLIEFVRNKYDWQKISKQTINVYRSALGQS